MQVHKVQWVILQISYTNTIWIFNLKSTNSMPTIIDLYIHEL